MSKGFTLIEALIATVMVGVGAVAVTGLGGLSTRLAFENERQVVATGLATQRMEQIRALAYSDVDTVPPGVLVGEEVVPRNNQSYTVKTTVTPVDDPLAAGAGDYKKVQITVAWISAGDNPRQVVLSSYVTPGGSAGYVTATPPAELICPTPTPTVNPHPTSTCDWLLATVDNPAQVYRYDGRGWVSLGQVEDASAITAFGGLHLIGTSPLGRVHLNGFSVAKSEGSLGDSTAVYSFTQSTSGQLYAGTGPAGKVFVKTGPSAPDTNGQATGWQEIGTPGGEPTQRVNALAYYNGAVYAGVGPQARIFRYDGSSSWTDVSGQLTASGEIVSLAVFSDGALYAGLSAGQGVFRSTDGTAWAFTGTLGTGGDVVKLQAAANTVFDPNPILFGLNKNGQQRGLWRYNGGTTWIFVGDSGTASMVYTDLVPYGGALAVGGGATGRVFAAQVAQWSDLAFPDPRAVEKVGIEARGCTYCGTPPCDCGVICSTAGPCVPTSSQCPSPTPTATTSPTPTITGTTTPVPSPTPIPNDPFPGDECSCGPYMSACNGFCIPAGQLCTTSDFSGVYPQLPPECTAPSSPTPTPSGTGGSGGGTGGNNGTGTGGGSGGDTGGTGGNNGTGGGSGGGTGGNNGTGTGGTTGTTTGGGTTGGTGGQCTGPCTVACAVPYAQQCDYYLDNGCNGLDDEFLKPSPGTCCVYIKDACSNDTGASCLDAQNGSQNPALCDPVLSQ